MNDLEVVETHDHDGDQDGVYGAQNKEPGSSQSAAQLFQKLSEVVKEILQQMSVPQFTACFRSRISSFRLYQRKNR